MTSKMSPSQRGIANTIQKTLDKYVGYETTVHSADGSDFRTGELRELLHERENGLKLFYVRDESNPNQAAVFTAHNVSHVGAHGENIYLCEVE